MPTVADALMAEISRVRDQVMPAYLSIGAAGVPGLTMMRAELDAAVRALAEQDGVECIRLLQSLKGYHT